MAKYERWIYLSEEGFWCEPPEGCTSLYLKMPILLPGCDWQDDGPHIRYRERLFKREKLAGPARITDAMINDLTGATKVEV